MYAKPSIFRKDAVMGKLSRRYKYHCIAEQELSISSLLREKRGGYEYDRRFQGQFQTSLEFWLVILILHESLYDPSEMEVQRARHPG